MATISSDSYSIIPSYVKYSKYLYNNKKSKAINRKPIFAPILEEPSNIVQNLQDLNTSSIPITNNNNNNSSFENSINGTYIVDYHTMNKFRPSLNLSCLPPVFEIPRKKIVDNNNSNNNNNMLLVNNKSLYNDKNRNNNNENKLMMRNSRLNLRPIVNNNLNSNSNSNNINIFNNTAGGVNNNINSTNNKSNFVSLPPINSHTNYNNIYNNNLNKINNNHINYSSNKINPNKNSNNSTYNIRNYNQRKKQYLKPIQFKNSPNPSSYNAYGINNNETKRTIDGDKQQSGSYGKNQAKYYYNLNNRNIIRNEKLKEERALRHKEMSNISINQNKNYVDKNIVINFNNTKINNTSTNIINMNLSSSININEYIEINRDKNRVLHIPTLRIYDRFDIPIKNWNSYENYVKNWSKMMRGVLEIKGCIENNEQNCYSIIIERSKNCSLGNLLRSIGSINEYIIISIVKQIIPLIQKYNGIFDYRNKDINEQIFNFIDIDNIWFNENYNVVLYPGKFKYYNKNEKLENFLQKIFGEKKDSQINIDLMNLGITLININIFLLDISVEDLFQLIKKGDEDINDICCLFHYFYKKINIFSNFYESLKTNDLELAQNYFDFLHILTSFKKNENENINIFESLVNHPFIVNSSIVNENTNINELIKVSKKYDFSNEYYTSNANILSFDLITRNISKKLNNYENFFSQHNIHDTKTLFNLYNIEIEELCRELRVNEEELHDKLLVLYENLLENKENNY